MRQKLISFCDLLSEFIQHYFFCHILLVKADMSLPRFKVRGIDSTSWGKRDKIMLEKNVWEGRYFWKIKSGSGKYNLLQFMNYSKVFQRIFFLISEGSVGAAYHSKSWIPSTYHSNHSFHSRLPKDSQSPKRGNEKWRKKAIFSKPLFHSAAKLILVLLDLGPKACLYLIFK